MNFNSLNIPNNQSKVAIVVVGYNRLKSIQRLLDSLLNAKYPTGDIPLVISIDASGNTALYEYVQHFYWPYGKKYLNIQSKRLGLKEHIFQCGDLTKYFKAIILLEDDLYVSPFFYTYTLRAIDTYGDDRRVAQISLYKNERNGYVGLPFVNLQNGADVFLMQDVSTWGECWTSMMWNDFKEWLGLHSEEHIQNVDMPIAIKNWTRAWSKYYNAYVVDTNKYVIYPNISVTTNFSDAGEHGGDNNSIVQVNLLQNDVNYRMYSFEELVKYDIYFNNEELYRWLGIPQEELYLDVYGFHKGTNRKKYILSTKDLPYVVVRAFALNMRPIELNVQYNINGKGLFLYDTTLPRKKCTNKDYNDLVVPYFLEGFNIKLLCKYCYNYCKDALIRKIRAI